MKIDYTVDLTHLLKWPLGVVAGVVGLVGGVFSLIFLLKQNKYRLLEKIEELWVLSLVREVKKVLMRK